MAAYSNFRSVNQIEAEKQAVREERKKVLERAQKEYEKSEKRREKARQAGEGTWMLSSIDERIAKEQKDMEKMKKKKKDKKKKKKQKKEKKRKRHSSSSDSSLSEAEEVWTEKGSQPLQSAPVSRPVAGPCLQRDSWMERPLVTGVIPTVTREELRKRKKGEEDQKKAEEARLLSEPGQHARELNPYWKDGGTGVPENKPTVPVASASAGDGGLSWLRKAYQRCQQQAKDEGRSLEDVAAERYGSLEELMSKIREAENASGLGMGQRHDHRMQGDSRPCYPSSSSVRRSSDMHRDENKSERGKRDDNDYRKSQVNNPPHRDRRERRDRDRDSRERERRNSRERSYRRDEYRGRNDRDSDGEDHRQDRRGKHDGEKDACKESSADKRRFIRPDSDSNFETHSAKKRTFMVPSEEEHASKKRMFMMPSEDVHASETRTSSLHSGKGRFTKPTSDSDDADSPAVYHQRSRDREDKKHGTSGGWRKKLPTAAQKGEGSVRKGSVPAERRRKRSASSSSHSRSESSSSSSESESDKEEEEGRGRREEKPSIVVKALSEDEMNSLGARILRAEMMGEEELAKQLKAQLEQAQKAKEAAPKARSEVTPNSASRTKEEEEKTVVLTRTGRDGMVRPLPEQEFDRDKGGKKRRKQKNVDTHSRGGERTRYFDDDDRHDLKTLVEMEKLGTAEDQNAMFSRLAGRSTEQTNDDFQVDDVFLSKAARQQSGARNEERERSKAIFEHRKMSGAMDKCQLCFSKIPKHLLIAIGSKVYLSLPAHRSLTPGHCLIVPMQHSAAATVLDEDVWQEVQTFRKTLVQMFAAQDQDVVFMETSMHLRHFPHMALECIPLDREIGDMAPIYFKKAMLDAGPEWNSNKKVVDLSRKDIRHSVPKGFPYFSVDFGLQGGYAHVIEDEKTFPSYFGREIVGGMIDAEPGLWRKPHREGFEDQRRKVLEFEKWWKPYDFTCQ